MFKRLSFFVLTGFCISMIVATSLVADENKDEHVSVGVRAESIEARMAKIEKRTQMANMYPEGISDLEKMSGKAKSLEPLKEIFNPKISYVLHPASYQASSFFYSYEHGCVMIELTDGSTWFVDPSEYNAITNWVTTDFVIITENHAWWSPFAFRLTNKRTGQSVGINIDLGPIAPIYACYHTHWIVDIDYYNNIVFLEDGSIWYMSTMDRNTVNQWIAGDIVIIGVNDGWLFAYNPNMLINVAMLNFAVGAAVF